jgi:hypothetical protein
MSSSDDGWDNTTKIKGYIAQRAALTNPVTVTINSTCPATTGSATVTLENTSDQSITGVLQFIVKENGIPHSWASFTKVDCAVRDFVPDENGEEITIGAGEEVTKTRDFTLDNTWVKDSCRVVAFLQKADFEIVGAGISNVDDPTAVKKDQTNNAESISLLMTRGSKMLHVPFNGTHTVSISDARGREVARFAPGNGMQWYTLPDNLPTGVTVVSVQTENGRYVKKVLFMK